jgi:Putative prokaryotic signal transducing protein
MSLVELARYPNAMEAMMVKGLLEAAGIDAVVFDHGMNIADSSGWLVPVRVMVLDEDEAEARQLLDASS